LLIDTHRRGLKIDAETPESIPLTYNNGDRDKDVLFNNIS
jgi:hypothetical protein